MVFKHVFFSIWFSGPMHYHDFSILYLFLVFKLVDWSFFSMQDCASIFSTSFCSRKSCWEAGFAPDSFAAAFTTHHQPFALLGCLLCSSHSEDGWGNLPRFRVAVPVWNLLPKLFILESRCNLSFHVVSSLFVRWFFHELPCHFFWAHTPWEIFGYDSALWIITLKSKWVWFSDVPYTFVHVWLWTKDTIVPLRYAIIIAITSFITIIIVIVPYYSKINYHPWCLVCGSH